LILSFHFSTVYRTVGRSQNLIKLDLQLDNVLVTQEKTAANQTPPLTQKSQNPPWGQCEVTFLHYMQGA
jgi:hypothetical protein